MHSSKQKDENATVISNSYWDPDSSLALHLENQLTITSLLALGVIIALIITVFIAYQSCKLMRRRRNAGIMKDMKTESKDVELSTYLMREKALEKKKFEFTIPKIRVYKASNDDEEMCALRESAEHDYDDDYYSTSTSEDSNIILQPYE